MVSRSSMVRAVESLPPLKPHHPRDVPGLPIQALRSTTLRVLDETLHNLIVTFNDLSHQRSYSEGPVGRRFT